MHSAIPPHAACSSSRWKRRCAVLALAMAPLLCAARQPSANECIEGSDFIRNAALARDGGMSESTFIRRIHEDIAAIQALPPQLRWFVQDEDDAALLIAAATDVFRHPKDAEAHRADFLKLCLPRVGGKSFYEL